MPTTLSIVSVRTGAEVSRAILADDGQVTYEGGNSAASAVRRWLRGHPGATEADAIRGLLDEGWSNGYLMVSTD